MAELLIAATEECKCMKMMSDEQDFADAPNNDMTSSHQGMLVCVRVCSKMLTIPARQPVCVAVIIITGHCSHFNVY